MPGDDSLRGAESSERPPASRVLLVVEDAQLRKLVGALLTRERFVVSECGTAQAAFAHPALASMDVVVCDEDLGDMNGVAFAVRFRQRFPAIPIVTLVSASFSGDPASAPDLVRKPFTATELIWAIRSLL
jgi:two-component system OmpR family response regulator